MTDGDQQLIGHAIRIAADYGHIDQEGASRLTARVRRTGGSLERELNEAERRAWDALTRYKFLMFGYWAAIWVHLNRLGGFKRPNPWKALVHGARAR